MNHRCLQEITYLTSSATLNPLSTTSFATPAIPRPRKTLSENNLPAGTLPLPSTSTAPLSLHPLPPNPPGMYSFNGNRPIESTTNYPSDPASVFVPLKRQVSLQGPRSLLGEVPVVEEEIVVERSLESGPTTTSMMALKPPVSMPPIVPPTVQNAPMLAKDKVESEIKEDELSLGESGRRGSVSILGLEEKEREKTLSMPFVAKVKEEDKDS